MNIFWKYCIGLNQNPCQHSRAVLISSPAVRLYAIKKNERVYQYCSGAIFIVIQETSPTKQYILSRLHRIASCPSTHHHLHMSITDQ